jgi:uncharacterized coiled-coil protein SlyX
MTEICFCCSMVSNNVYICGKCVKYYVNIGKHLESEIMFELKKLKKCFLHVFNDKTKTMEKLTRINSLKISISNYKKSIEETSKLIAEKEKIIEKLKEMRNKKVTNKVLFKSAEAEFNENKQNLLKEKNDFYNKQSEIKFNPLIKNFFVNNFLETILNSYDIKNLNDYLEIQTLTHLNTNNINPNYFEQINNQLSEFRGFIVDIKETTVRYLSFKQELDSFNIIYLNKYIYKVLYFIELMTVMLSIQLPFPVCSRKLIIKDQSDNYIEVMFDYNGLQKDTINGYQLIECNLREIQNYLNLNLKKTDIFDLSNFLNLRKLYTGSSDIKNTETYDVVKTDIILIDDYFLVVKD